MLLKEQKPLYEEVSRSWNLTGLLSADERNGGMAFSLYHLSTVFIGEIPLTESDCSISNIAYYMHLPSMGTTQILKSSLLINIISLK